MKTHKDSSSGDRSGCGPRGRHHRRGRKERVLHTRVSDNLAEDIRRIAEDLRVPASNLVRNVLEEVFDVVESVSDDVGEILEDVLDEAEGARGRMARARGRAHHRRRTRRRRRDAAEPGDQAAWRAAEAEVEEAERSGESVPPPPPLEWHFLDGGETTGPVDRETLRGAAREGRVRSDTLVWTPGMADWKPAGRVRGLDGIFAPPPPPPTASENPAPGEEGSS